MDILNIFAEKIDSTVHIVNGGGHLGEEFKELPIVLDICKNNI